MFELAAYKKVNPNGRLTVRPLFMERMVALLWLAVAGLLLKPSSGVSTILKPIFLALGSKLSISTPPVNIDHTASISRGYHGMWG